MPQSLSNLPIGALVKFGKHQIASEAPEPIIWMISDKNHKGYPANSVTFTTKYVIDSRCFDEREPKATNSIRQQNGDERYSLSNIDQWLNKSDASNWYKPTHSSDEPPVSGKEAYANRPGFLYNFTSKERDSLLLTDIVVNETGESGRENAVTKTYQRKIFLLSFAEVNVTNSYKYAKGKPEGYPLAAFVDDSTRKAKTTYQLVKNGNFSAPNVQFYDWYLRSGIQPDEKHVEAGTFAQVSYGGSPNFSLGSATGIRPSLNLPNTTPVSDTTDEDGCYAVLYNKPPQKPPFINIPETIKGGQSVSIAWGKSTDPEGDFAGYILQRKVDTDEWNQIYKGKDRTYTDVASNDWSKVQYRVCGYDVSNSAWQTSVEKSIIKNAPPVISGADSDLGIKSAAFTQTYTVTDADEEGVTVTEAIDGNVIRSFSVVLGNSNTARVFDENWLTLSNGTHALTITAKDQIGNTTVRTYTFTKEINSFTISNTMPYDCDTKPIRIKVSMTYAIPEGAEMDLQVCNNAYDELPAWEKASVAELHVFTNEKKTAARWGVGVKVHITRGTGVGACYVSQIGGNFE